jgi:hypothetical protein
MDIAHNRYSISNVINGKFLRSFNSSNCDGDRVIVVQELLVAMRSANEDVMLQKQHYRQDVLQQQLQQQQDEDVGHMQERLKASEARCSSLSHQLQQLQLHSQQLHAEDLRRANTLLQASESRGTALAQQLQVCRFVMAFACSSCLKSAQSVQAHATKVAEDYASSAAAQEKKQQQLQVPCGCLNLEHIFCANFVCSPWCRK